MNFNLDIKDHMCFYLFQTHLNCRFDEYIPLYLNHMQHTTVVPLLALELAIVYHVYPKRKERRMRF
jgi:hypothetical protein